MSLGAGGLAMIGVGISVAITGRKSLSASGCMGRAGLPMNVGGFGHNHAVKLRRLRHDDVLQDGDVMLIRGGELDPDVLRADAMRYHSVYGVYGISVFVVRDATVDELAQQVPLVRFERLTLLQVRDVLVAGMRLEPTGRNPHHFTVGFDDLENGVQRLVDCPHKVVPNTYYDA